VKKKEEEGKERKEKRSDLKKHKQSKFNFGRIKYIIQQ